MTFINSDKAVSEVVGYIIIMGLTVTGIAMISVVGLPAIYDMQDMANVRNAEQAFTVMDSRASAVVLGSSPVQFLDVNLGGAGLTVEPNSTTSESYIQVNIVNDSGNYFITVPMGKLTYQLGNRIVAYEGGGIWSKYPSGNSIMLSPPEFHYNGVTLTLPAINVSGNSSVGGKGSATVKLAKGLNPIEIKYPDASLNRTNPVNGSGGGKVYVNITSDFSDAWADYARSLGYTLVSEDAANSSVSIRLTVVPSTLGSSTSITDPITMRGLNPADPAPLGNWSFKIRLSGNNLNWDLRTSSGDKILIFYLKGSGLDLGDKVDLSIGYQDDGGGYSKPAEIWKGDDKIVVKEDAEGLYLDVDMLNTTLNLTYQKETVGAQACTPKIHDGDLNETGFSWGSETLTKGTTEKSLYNLTEHYIHLMLQEGDISLSHCGPQTPSGDSTVLVNYTAVGALTYLHISDNRVDVGIS